MNITSQIKILLLTPSFRRKRKFEIIFVIIIIYSHKLKLEIFSPNLERPCKIQINFANHNAKNLENQIFGQNDCQKDGKTATNVFPGFTFRRLTLSVTKHISKNMI